MPNFQSFLWSGRRREKYNVKTTEGFCSVTHMWQAHTVWALFFRHVTSILPHEFCLQDSTSPLITTAETTSISGSRCRSWSLMYSMCIKSKIVEYPNHVYMYYINKGCAMGTSKWPSITSWGVRDEVKFEPLIYKSKEKIKNWRRKPAYYLSERNRIPQIMEYDDPVISSMNIPRHVTSQALS
jgi:hypothetical protein